MADDNTSRLPDNEEALIDRLIRAANFKDDTSLWRNMEIRRGGKLIFAFRIRPLDEDEIADMKRQCTRFLPNPNDKRLPKLEGDTDFVRLRSLKIYSATVPEDRARIWDDKRLWQHFGVTEGFDMVDVLLMAGEKDAVLEQVDACSGYGSFSALEELAKN